MREVKKHKKEHKKESIGHLFYRLVMIIIGVGLAAIAIEFFLIANNIIDGGIIGIFLILDYIAPDSLSFINFAMLVIILNLPFMYSRSHQTKILCS